MKDFVALGIFVVAALAAIVIAPIWMITQTTIDRLSRAPLQR